MRPKSLAHLEYIRESVELVQRYVSDLDEPHYLKEVHTRDAVERRFTIIGEALNRLRRDAPEIHGRISHTAQIAAFRNLIVHVYEQIDHTIVWAVISRDLPLLHSQVVALLHELDQGAG